jgi:hypothetical protein
MSRRGEIRGEAVHGLARSVTPEGESIVEQMARFERDRAQYRPPTQEDREYDRRRRARTAELLRAFAVTGEYLVVRNTILVARVTVTVDRAGRKTVEVRR